MLQINTNIPALTGLRSLSQTQGRLNTSIERLSTGQRINSASDDPSGLVISEKLRTQINGLGAALQNTQNDINLINTAEAALQEISDILTSMRASVIFSLNTGFSIPEQIEAEQDKIDQSLVAIDRIAQTTRFSQRNLLNGDSDFVVEQDALDRTAVDDLQVRQVRLAPSTDTQKFSVNVTTLAERATLITDINFRSSVALATANPAGGNGSEFVTLRVSGSKGAEDINFGAGSTVQDLITGINQNATSTGVYADGYKALPIDSTFNDIVLENTAGGLTIGDDNNAIVFGIRINGGPVQNVVVTDDDDGTDSIIADGDVVTPGADNELVTALQAIDPNFVVDRDPAGNIRIANALQSFEFVGGQVNKFVIPADDLALINDADGDGTVDLDLTLDGAGTVIGTTGSALAGGANSNFNPASQADREALLTSLNGLGAAATVSFMFDTENNLVIVDTGSAFQSGGAGNIGLVPNGDAATGAALSGQPVTDGNYVDGLDVAGISTNGATSTNRPVEFVNIAISATHQDAAGNLQIDTSGMGAGGAFNFQLFDPETAALVQFSAAGTGPVVNGAASVTLTDINTAIQGAGFNTPGAWQAFYSPERGLSIVYNNDQATDGVIQATNGRFIIQDDAVGATNHLTVLTGTSAYSSHTNTELLALYSTEFGGDQVIKLEDVTSSTSSLALLSSANGGIRVTGDGRSGLGVLDGDNPTYSDLRYNTFATNGVDLGGTINGLEFGAKGVDVQIVTAALDLKFTASEGWGRDGELGRRAEAANFGFGSTVGATILQPGIAGEPLPVNVLDSFEFTIRQNFDGGPRGRNGLRFQIREGGGVQDSLTVGIRDVTTGNLGVDLSPESGNPNDPSRLLAQRGGLLNTLRSGAGNDLFQNPENALTILDQAIDQISDTRAFLGSISKDTLQRNINSVSVALENLTEAEATIRDVDFARETTEFARQQVLYAAGVNILGQANQQPQQLLQLLG